ncbi:MAG: ParB domain protein nuclease [Cypionkella sp.]|uniref:ParB/RepB/Spo0J family partition protein n=1 Tax=Cypionkella sp. TaxID=2811411 RepID=UPI0026161923|nr:ParB N-terminal domain-containing protein [Cypionkella sp.]MDB5658347.1 ParB domain protein nuclease [Cypionkella sp.]
MKTPIERDATQVPVADIIVRSRLRPVSEAAVESLIASIGELGVMKDAVHLRKRKEGLFLMAGAHRLEAAIRLGWDTIPAKIWTDVTDDWALLMEVDDNIAGAELNPLDTAVFLATRKKIYERLHPEAKAKSGAALAAARWNAADIMSVASFARATAEKFGIDERHVRRLVSLGGSLEPQEAVDLRTAPRQVTLKDLGDIAKMPRLGKERMAVIAALNQGKAKNAAEAFRAVKAANSGVPLTVIDPIEVAFKALSALWSRAPKAAKRRFVSEHFEELGLLGAEEEAARFEMDRPQLLAEIAATSGAAEE